MPNVNIQHLDKIYDGGVQAVYDFNLDIKDGEFIVLVGPSGCGKSTTLRMVAGLEDITNGKLIIDEKDCTRLPPKDRDIAMVFQNYALYGHMTIYENMAFSLTLRKESKEVIHRKVMAAAEILDLKSQLNKKPKQLSGGQRQRVAMGRAIVRNPKVFLFDEPLSNLDAKLRGSMRRELILLHKKLNATIMYVTHDQTEALTLADRIVCMSMGHVQQIGTPIDLYEKPANTFVATFIGLPPMNMFEGKIENGHFICEYFDYPLNDKQKAIFSNYYNERLSTVEVELNEAKDLLAQLQSELEALTAKLEAENNTKPNKAKDGLVAKINPLTEKVAYLEKMKENLSKGTAEVILGVRPENIVRPGPVKLHVTNNENLGMNTLVHGKVGGTKNVVCKFTEWCNYKADDEIEIGFDPQMMHFFELPEGDTPGKAIR